MALKLDRFVYQIDFTIAHTSARFLALLDEKSKIVEDLHFLLMKNQFEYNFLAMSRIDDVG